MHPYVAIIVGYVGEDVRTKFARDYKEELGKGTRENAKRSIILDGKFLELYEEYEPLWFTGNILSPSLETINAVRVGMPWESPTYSSKDVPVKFAVENLCIFHDFWHHPDLTLEIALTIGKECDDFWSYPRLPINLIKEGVERGSYEALRNVICNPSLFSEGIEVAEEIIEAIFSAHGKYIGVDCGLSANPGAPLEFFLRNPEYIVHRKISIWGREFFKGKEEDVMKILKSMPQNEENSDVWYMAAGNPLIPIAFLKDNMATFNNRTIRALCSNESIPSSFCLQLYSEEKKDQGRIEEVLLGLSKRKSTSFSFITASVEKYGPHLRDKVIQSSYNVPPRIITDMCASEPKRISWDIITSNRGFWLHLARENLTPVLMSFFSEIFP